MSTVRTKGWTAFDAAWVKTGEFTMPTSATSLSLGIEGKTFNVMGYGGNCGHHHETKDKALRCALSLGPSWRVAYHSGELTPNSYKGTVVTVEDETVTALHKTEGEQQNG